tara:strand:- start:1757 stop:2107 length:351 start_codon:yes stop_codon:yes gene_type:complete
MKLNTQKYKLALYSESVCPDCQKTKEILKENNIPFVNKCISIATPELKKENGDTRWEYIDAEREHPLPWYTPVLIIEDTEGNLTYIPSVKDKSLYDTGTSFENPEEVVETLKPYLI